MASITSFQILLLSCNRFQCFPQLSNFNIYRVQMFCKRKVERRVNQEITERENKCHDLVNRWHQAADVDHNNKMQKKGKWNRVRESSQTIFSKVVLIGYMTDMYVERNRLWCWIRIVETEFVHSTSRSLKLKLVSRCSLYILHRVPTRRFYLRKNQPCNV